ncbi:hypothetical protein SLS57_010685 [Botryosphaeria dothidea]
MTSLNVDNQDLSNFKDKVVLITGGASGIGLATALLAEQQGAKVVVGDINPLQSDKDIEGKNILYVPLDVTSWASQSSFFKKAYELHGKIDHVFANAGLAPKRNILDEDLDEAGELKQPNYHIIDVNQKGAMDTTFLALHYLKKQASGGVVPFPELDYSVSKHAVFGFVRSVDYNMSRSHPKIRCNAVAPCWTETGIVPAALAQLGAVVQQPSAVAQAVALLMTDESRRGQTVFTHGGKSWEIGELLYETIVQKLPFVPTPELMGVFDKMKDWAEYDEAQKTGAKQG